MKKPARLLCLLLAGCLGCALLAGCGGLRLLPELGGHAAGSDAQGTASGDAGPASPVEEGPASAGSRPLTEEEQAYWLRQAGLLARRLVERCFPPDALGRSSGELDPAVLLRFADSLACMQEEPDEAYLLAAAPELSADGMTCRLPFDRLCEALRHCFGWSEDTVRSTVSSVPDYDPAENCLEIQLEKGPYHYFSVTEADAVFTEADTIQLHLALWGNLDYEDPTDHGSCCMTLRLKQEDGQAFLQFESLLAGDPERAMLDELEHFLNDSQMLNWVDALALEELHADPGTPFRDVYTALSELLRQDARRENRPVQQNEDGVPFFPMEQFNAAAQELLGREWELDDFAAGRPDQAPQGMLCAAWGYDAGSTAQILLDRSTLRREGEEYSVQFDEYHSFPGDGGQPGLHRRRELTFLFNPEYEYAPVRLIALRNEA